MKTVGHNSDGEFMEFLVCKFLNLKLYKDKLTNEEIKTLCNYDILSITLNFSNNTSKSYNVTWNPISDHNNLQIIKEKRCFKDICWLALKYFYGTQFN